MISYKPLFRYMLEHDLKPADIQSKCGISRNTWTKFNKGEEVAMSVLTKICRAYDLQYGDLVELKEK